MGIFAPMRSTYDEHPAGLLSPHRWCGRSVMFATAAITALLPSPLLAQVARQLDLEDDAQDALHDAELATANLVTPSPLSNLYSTAPGLEQQIPAPEWRLNLLAPAGYNSNAEKIANGGTQTLETSPLGKLSWAAPVGNLPLRATVYTSAESARYFAAPRVDLDKLEASARVQYVDPTNDQAFSPYFAITPMWEFLPAFSHQLSARQDFNIGFNKKYSFDGDFRPMPAASNTSTSSVWSFGLTAFVQRRLREPEDSSSAVFVIPSLSYVMSRDWNASLAVEFLGRWYDADGLGFSRRDLEMLSAGTIEYVIPVSLFGGEKIANAFGRPALDFQGSYLKAWSNAPGASFGQFRARVTLKLGWLF